MSAYFSRKWVDDTDTIEITAYDGSGSRYDEGAVKIGPYSLREAIRLRDELDEAISEVARSIGLKP